MSGNTSSMSRQCVTMNDGGTTMPFADINQPGTYICNWSGHLLRVPGDDATGERVQPIDIVGLEPPQVTKLSGNPYVPVTKARMLAADLDAPVNF